MRTSYNIIIHYKIIIIYNLNIYNYMDQLNNIENFKSRFEGGRSRGQARSVSQNIGRNRSPNRRYPRQTSRSYRLGGTGGGPFWGWGYYPWTTSLYPIYDYIEYPEFVELIPKDEVKEVKEEVKKIKEEKKIEKFITIKSIIPTYK